MRNTLQWCGRSGELACSLSFSLSLSLSFSPRCQVRQRESQDARQPQQSRSILLFHSAPLLPALLTSATQTTRLCCKQHTCWLHSPSGPAPSLAQLSEQRRRSVYNLGTQSRSYNNCSIYFTLCSWEKKEERRLYILLMIMHNKRDENHPCPINVSHRRLTLWSGFNASTCCCYSGKSRRISLRAFFLQTQRKGTIFVLLLK